MKLSFKKLLSLALVFSMMISALQVNVFAHNVEEKLEEAYSIAESLTFDEADASVQEPLEEQGLSLEAEAVKEGEEKKLEDIPESEPVFEYPFRESDEMLLMEEIEATVNTTAGSVFRAAKEAVILFTVPEGIETVESLVITGGTAEYGTAEYSLTEINGRTFQTHIKNLEPETSYTVTPVFEEGYGNSYSFNTRAEITGIQASWNTSNARIDLYGKNGEKTTYSNQGWHFANSSSLLTYNIIPYNTSENTVLIPSCLPTREAISSTVKDSWRIPTAAPWRRQPPQNGGATTVTTETMYITTVTTQILREPTAERHSPGRA